MTTTKAAQLLTAGLNALHLVENVLLPNGTRRLKFQQRGQVPDVEALRKQYGPKDGQYVVCKAWMDTQGVGHAQLAWKEYLQSTLPAIEGEKHG